LNPFVSYLIFISIDFIISKKYININDVSQGRASLLASYASDYILRQNAVGSWNRLTICTGSLPHPDPDDEKHTTFFHSCGSNGDLHKEWPHEISACSGKLHSKTAIASIARFMLHQLASNNLTKNQWKVCETDFMTAYIFFKCHEIYFLPNLCLFKIILINLKVLTHIKYSILTMIKRIY